MQYLPWILAWGALANISSLHPAAAELALVSPKSEVLFCEPLFVNLTGTLEAQHKPEFELFVNGQTLMEKSPEVLGQQLVQVIGENDGETIKVVASWVFLYDLYSNKFLFDKAGKYTVQLREVTNNVFSNELVINVKATNEYDAMAVGLFGGPAQMLAIYTDEPSEGGLKALEKLVETYPDSMYSDYARFILFKRRFEVLIKIPVNSKNEQIEKLKKFGLLAEQFSRTENIPSPSAWHGQSLLYLAHCRALSGNLNQSRNDLKAITRLYSQGPFSAKATKMLQELENDQQQEAD